MTRGNWVVCSLLQLQSLPSCGSYTYITLQLDRNVTNSKRSFGTLRRALGTMPSVNINHWHLKNYTRQWIYSVFHWYFHNFLWYFYCFWIYCSLFLPPFFTRCDLIQSSLLLDSNIWISVVRLFIRMLTFYKKTYMSR